MPHTIYYTPCTIYCNAQQASTQHWLHGQPAQWAPRIQTFQAPSQAGPHPPLNTLPELVARAIPATPSVQVRPVIQIGNRQ